MTHLDLQRIAEQYHSGRRGQEIDFGGVDLDQMGQLRQVFLALKRYPTADSLGNGSNEVFLPMRKVVKGIPDNILPFNRFPAAPPVRQTPTAKPTSKAGKSNPKASSGSMVHWKLKIGTWRQKQQLFADLEWREESLRNAYTDFREGVGEWQAVEQTHLEYIDKILEANTFIATVWDDQEEYYWSRSKSWQDSNAAWAYQSWMEAWEREIPSPNLPIRNGIVNLNLDASKVFHSLPDEPDLSR